jgi:hypothetical protein
MLCMNCVLGLEELMARFGNFFEAFFFLTQLIGKANDRRNSNSLVSM